jgi:phosphoribosylamine--glycine ligase
MKIGLVGSGGREHALAKALVRDPQNNSLFVIGSHQNPGIVRLAQESRVMDLTQIKSITEFFISKGTDLVVIGPELPLMAGLVDELRAHQIRAVGPTRAQSRLEADKSFMRLLLSQLVGWGAPRWQTVRDTREAKKFIDSAGSVAVKPVGLTGGKGVRLMGAHLKTVDQVLDEVEVWIRKDGKVLLEELIVGEEFSRIVFTSDGLIAPMPVAQDFKYGYDNDLGGMTGGMGSYTMIDGSMPFLAPSDLALADQIIQIALASLEEETGQKYRGFLYGQFIASQDGVKVIEFNVRLGDPEALNEIALLNVDALTLFRDIAMGEMEAGQIDFVKQASVCKYLVPCEYPDPISAELSFRFDELQIEEAGFELIFSSVTGKDDTLTTLGSRALALVGLGADPYRISDKMEGLLSEIEPEGLRHRKDVGDYQVIQRKKRHMDQLRTLIG